MLAPTRSLVLAAAMTLVASPLLKAAEETVLGKLTTTEDQALYGVAIMRAAPDIESEPVGKLIAGSRVTVFPETSPDGWWYIEMVVNNESSTGFVPRSFVKMNQGPFKDVPDDHWAAASIKRLKASGDLSGYKGGRFEGEKAFSRYEMAVLLDKYMGRLKTARKKIEDSIANIPMQTHLGGHDAKSLDGVIQNLERISKEEKALQGMMAQIRTQVDQHERRLNTMHDEFASVVHHDRTQDKKLDELARTASKLSAEVASLRSMGKTYARAQVDQPGVTVAMAANVVKVKELLRRAETLEAKVGALESRDRLARLLRSEEAVRAEDAPVLALNTSTDQALKGQM